MMTKRTKAVSLLNRGSIQHLAIEAMVVVFSILAALSVDAWRDERVERRSAVEAANGLNLEIARNLKELEDMLADVTGRQDRLLALGDSLTKPMPFSRHMGSFNGFRTPDLSHSAWQRASGAAIANRLDPDYLQDAFRAYNAADLLSGLDAEISRLVFSETFYAPDRARAAWYIALAIMRQQIEWVRSAADLDRQFLERWAPQLLEAGS